MKKWRILKERKNKSKIYSAEEIVSILLENRGVRTDSQIRSFLKPSLDGLSLENVLVSKKELKKALNRIKRAAHDQETIAVYTDYDADGICSGAILWETLDLLGIKAMPYIPDRVKEGYGLSKKGIDKVKEQLRAKLIITVDHGITSDEQILYAKSLGIDTIVVDHHVLPSFGQPKAFAVIHSTLLSAAALTYLFSQFLKKELFRKTSNLTDKSGYTHLDLAAIATIADLIPLQGINRAIVSFGLEKLNKTGRVGLKALMSESGIKKENISATQVGYAISPRINAAGRVGSPIDALRLLCTTDPKRAKVLAKKLDRANRKRQQMTEEAVRYAMSCVEDELYLNKIRREKLRLIFIGDRSFNQGVIGLIASRLVDKFYLPSVVLSLADPYSKASARSIKGFDIVDLVKEASDILENVGGHPQACGFTVKTENIGKLKKELTAIANNQLSGSRPQPVVCIDAELNLTEISTNLFLEIEKLSPFGYGNPSPVFATRGLKVKNAYLVGRNRNHLKLKLVQDSPDHSFDAIGFGMGKFYRKLSAGQKVDVAYTIDQNSWNGRKVLQLKLKDVMIADTDKS